jgi:hypothetical protein
LYPEKIPCHEIYGEWLIDEMAYPEENLKKAALAMTVVNLLNQILKVSHPTRSPICA